MPADRSQAKAYSYVPSLSSRSPRSSPLFVRLRIGSVEGEGGGKKTESMQKICVPSESKQDEKKWKKKGKIADKPDLTDVMYTLL